MKIKDKSCGVMVDVCCKDCLKYKCYWPRPNPGSFTLGQGYMSYRDERGNMWLCGTREIHGCPENPEVKS